MGLQEDRGVEQMSTSASLVLLSECALTNCIGSCEDVITALVLYTWGSNHYICVSPGMPAPWPMQKKVLLVRAIWL